MIEYISGYNAAYEAFNAGHPYGTVFQSYLWSGVKSAWRWRAAMVRNGSVITGAMSVLIRSIPGTRRSLLYAPRGPICDPHDEGTLMELTTAMKVIAGEEHAYLLKLDPDVKYEDERFRALMAQLGYRLGQETTHFENVQPQYVVRLHVAGKSEAEVFAALKSKTRYNIRLAGRRGVEVRICGKEKLPEFCRLMETTGKRDSFCTRPMSYFARMLDALGDHVRLYIAYSDGEAIAGTICAQYGNKTWYLYGASANEHREKMPNYLLQWRMIQWALKSHCDIYDFRGISGSEDPDNPLAGLWRFKSGWGGEKTKFAGEFEYVFRPPVYLLMKHLLPLMRKAVVLSARIKRLFR